MDSVRARPTNATALNKEAAAAVAEVNMVVLVSIKAAAVLTLLVVLLVVG